MLDILTEPGLLYTLIPVGVVVMGVVSFEIAMAITICALPRSRFHQRWAPQEQRRVLRTFGLVFCVWPITAAVILAHVYLTLLFALAADALVLGLIGLGVWWIIRGLREAKLVEAGHCEHCLYDLRASQDNDHCPECGALLHHHPTRRKRQQHKRAAAPRL